MSNYCLLLGEEYFHVSFISNQNHHIHIYNATSSILTHNIHVQYNTMDNKVIIYCTIVINEVLVLIFIPISWILI